jgi:murein DD-endopeptidase MepM/ murein hydrolase activator NlpD
VIGTILFVTWTGPRDLARYPEARTSPYWLPWRAGVRCLCIQGNRAVVSHTERDGEEFAYDFAMPIGSDVCAARDGTVIHVDVDHDGNGLRMPNNQILVHHGDGSIGWYLHLKKGGCYVHAGDHIKRGQAIGASGNVGISTLPHLHFQVTKPEDAAPSAGVAAVAPVAQHFRVAKVGGPSVPLTFADIAGDGIPRMFARYTSGNTNPSLD